MADVRREIVEKGEGVLSLLLKVGDWLLTRAVWVVVGFLLCIPLLSGGPDPVVQNSIPLAQVIANQTLPVAVRPPVEAPVSVVVSTCGVITVRTRQYGFCVSPGFGVGYAGRPVGVVDVKLAYAGGYGVGVGLGVGRGVFPYWAAMWDPRKRGWSLYLGGGILEKRAIAGVRVRF